MSENFDVNKVLGHRHVEIPPISDEAIKTAQKTLLWNNRSRDTLSICPRESVAVDYVATKETQENDVKRDVNLSVGLWDSVLNWFNEIFFGSEEETVEDTAKPVGQRPEVAAPNRPDRKEKQSYRRTNQELRRSQDMHRGNLNDEWNDTRTIEQNVLALRMTRKDELEEIASITRDIVVQRGKQQQSLRRDRIEELDRLLEHEKRTGLAGGVSRGVTFLALAVSGLKALAAGATPTLGAGLALLVVLHLDEATDHKTTNKLISLIAGNNAETKEQWAKYRDMTSAALLIMGTGFLGYQHGGSDVAKVLIGGAQAVAHGVEGVTTYQQGVSQAKMTHFNDSLEQLSEYIRRYRSDLHNSNKEVLSVYAEASKAEQRHQQACSMLTI